MKLRLWLLFALAAVALLTTGVPVFRDAHHTRSSGTIFNTILAQAYPGWSGFRSCQPTPTPDHDLCWAELHRGNRYRQVQIDLDLSTENPIPHEVAHIEPWTRAPMHIASPEGFGTANTRAYGWEYVMKSVPERRLPVTFFAVDDDHTMYPAAMFRFRCTGKPTRITCRNSLGDYLTFTPNAA